MANGDRAVSIPFPRPPADTDAVLALRTEFRAFLDRELAGRSPRARSDNWYGFDRKFSSEHGNFMTNRRGCRHGGLRKRRGKRRGKRLMTGRAF